MTKKIFAITLVAIATVSLVFVSGVKSRMKPYYNGDAEFYNNKTIIASANMDRIEVFMVDGNKLVKTADIFSFRNQYSKTNSFYDIALHQENGSLMLYAVDGMYFYKYDISNYYQPRLVNQLKDNSWDYMVGVEKAGSNRMATIGSKGIKIWNNDMMVIDSFNIIKTNGQYNIVFSPNNSYIFDVNKEVVTIFDALRRTAISSFNIKVNEDHNRKVYNAGDSDLYVADDSSLKKVDFSGNIKGEFKHTSNLAYDVVGSADSRYVYFSDGIGVVKIEKETMKLVKYVYTASLGSAGGWAMGLKSVAVNGGDNLVVFNNSNILVLDGDLKKVASYTSVDDDTKPIYPRESLYLKVDKNHAAANSQILLSGGGYSPEEEIIISFANSKISANTDISGRFVKLLTVPSVEKKGGYDIKVVGSLSGQNYSIGFNIE